MDTLNNNRLKAQLFSFAASSAVVVEYKECWKDDPNINRCDFEITILTNGEIEVVMKFDYWCKLLQIKHKGRVDMFNGAAFRTIADIVDRARELNRSVFQGVAAGEGVGA